MPALDNTKKDDGRIYYRAYTISDADEFSPVDDSVIKNLVINAIKEKVMKTCPIIWKIEARRAELGLTMQEMCEPSGVSYRTYQSWLYNGVDPSYSKLVKILSAVGLKLVVEEEKNG